MLSLDTGIQRLKDYSGELFDAQLPEAAILVPVIWDENRPRMILTRRSDQLRTHQGQVAFPGGKLDPEDESLQAAALRECHEELDILPSQVKVVGKLSQLVSLHGLKVTPYVGLIPSEINITPNPDEIESVFSAPFSYFLTAQPKTMHRMNYKDYVVNVPSYDYQFGRTQYQIWGLSAIVICELMNVLYDANIQIKEKK